LSSGTLQLSIRCSSIHFLPRRSFPVSVSVEVLESGTGSLRRELSCAVAGSAKKIARSAPTVPMYDDRMMVLEVHVVFAASIRVLD
jgi:hypothetical protein